MELQPPRGTRDFYPETMAYRRWLEDAWRAASIRNGFEEVDGPIFETLDLYKIKSGEGIVSELFSFRRTGGKTDYALRPEFTPTLARMVAARAQGLPKPVKWFCLPNLCRAEKPQRGRLREFLQWNVDVLGLDDSLADAEVIHTAVDLMRRLGLGPKHVKVKISHRDVVGRILRRLGLEDEAAVVRAFDLLDRRDKMEVDVFAKQAAALGLDAETLDRFNQIARAHHHADQPWDQISERFPVPADDLQDLRELHLNLKGFGIADWCEYDLGIVRGLAYYTGTVFEIHEVSGAERAIAGGGRYDQLIELFGGPPTPAVGFGMGDVVLSLVLADKGLMPQHVAPAPDAFVMVADAQARPRLTPVVAALRAAGLHVRFSYKETTKVGKLLKDAAACRARFAIILDARTLEADVAAVKDLGSGDQVEVPISDLAGHLSSSPQN